MRTVADLADHVRGHRCYTHPVFRHWADVDPDHEVVGALFHQIQSFCASTRPGLAFPDALRELGMASGGRLFDEIVESEEDHGPELATMAGHIVNRKAGRVVCPDLADQAAVEAELRAASDRLLAHLPGYDDETGLTVQVRRAIAVFERRGESDRESTLRNLGTAVALEMISNRHLIPGEKHCLVDRGLYGTTLDEPEMHYLFEHWGEAGAEELHEQNALEAVAAILDETTEELVFAGADDFLDSLTAVWDVLDSALLGSGSLDDGVRPDVVTAPTREPAFAG